MSKLRESETIKERLQRHVERLETWKRSRTELYQNHGHLNHIWHIPCESFSLQSYLIVFLLTFFHIFGLHVPWRALQTSSVRRQIGHNRQNTEDATLRDGTEVLLPKKEKFLFFGASSMFKSPVKARKTPAKVRRSSFVCCKRPWHGIWA